MPAPPEAVYAALTDAAALRVWLAEHAEVALPDRYEFWGRYTPDGAEPHQRLLHADERTLRFAWTVDGVESTVSFDLAEDESGTLLTLSQSDLPSWPEVLADTAGVRGALQTFWSLAIANLSDYLSSRELTPKCDFTSAELRASVVIDAAPEAVFDSLTQPEQFRKWFGANVDIEPYVGGRFAMGGFELDPGGGQVRRVRAGPQGHAAVRRRHHPGLGAGRLGRQDPAHVHAERVRPGQPALPGLDRLAGWCRRVAALPRTPAVAHDLASDRAPWCASGDAEHRRLAVFQRGIDMETPGESPGFPQHSGSELHDVHGGLLGRRRTAVDAHVLGDLVLLRYGKCRDVTGVFRDQAAPLVPQVRPLGCQPVTLLLTAPRTGLTKITGTRGLIVSVCPGGGLAGGLER